MKKLLAYVVAASFTAVCAGSFAATHTAAAPMKDAPKVDCKDPKNKDHKDCKGAKKDEMKK
jgi:hypothetical protein